MSVGTSTEDMTAALPVLWSTWFEAGAQSVERGDHTAAIEWLTEALNYIRHCPPDERRRALTEATLAYAYYRRARELEECELDPCLSNPVMSPEELKALAGRYLAAARQHAECANRCVTHTESQIRVALGRAAFVLGELALEANDLACAETHYQAARNLLDGIAFAAMLVDEIIRQQFEIHYRSGEYRRALADLELLERGFPGAAAAAGERLAWLLACRADCRLRLGQYALADEIYPRWRRLAAACDQGDECSRRCVYALSVFARTRFMLGYYDGADRLSRRAATAVRRLRKPYPWIAFEIHLLRGELDTRRGAYRCAADRLLDAEAALEGLEKYCLYLWECRSRLDSARGRFCTAIGRLDDAISAFADARKHAEARCRKSYLLLVPALLGAARIASLRSSPSRAMEYVRCAYCALEQAGALETAEMAWTLAENAFVFVQDDKPREADPACRRALRALAAALRPNHPDEAFIRTTLAQSLSARHEACAALEAITAARRSAERETPYDWFALARMHAVEGEIHHTRRDHCTAACVLTCAGRLWEEQERLHRDLDPDHGPYEHPEKSMLLLSRAAVEVGRGDSPSANAMLEAGRFHELAVAWKKDEAQLAYELNRRGNLAMRHQQYEEAVWYFAWAVPYYERDCGKAHAFTMACRKNLERAQQSAKEHPAEPCRGGCPCTPWSLPCRSPDLSECCAGPCGEKPCCEGPAVDHEEAKK